MHIYSNCSKVLNHLLGVLSLACARFASEHFTSVTYCILDSKLSRDENALILSLLAHVCPSTLRDGKYMWGVIVSPPATILLNDSIGI
jgi:hypothetical protein